MRRTRDEITAAGRVADLKVWQVVFYPPGDDSTEVIDEMCLTLEEARRRLREWREQTRGRGRVEAVFIAAERGRP